MFNIIKQEGIIVSSIQVVSVQVSIEVYTD